MNSTTTLRFKTLILLLLCTSILQAQNRNQVLIQDLIEEIVNCKEDTFLLENTLVYSDNFVFEDSIIRTVNCNVMLDEVVFTNKNQLHFNNLHFKKGLLVYSEDSLHGRFENCIFERGAFVYSKDIAAVFKGCTFKEGLASYAETGRMHIYDSDFEIKGKKYDDFSWVTEEINITFWKKGPLYIRKSSFSGHSDCKITINKNSSEDIDMESIQISDNTFDIPLEMDKIIVSDYELSNNKFSAPVRLFNVNFKNQCKVSQCQFDSTLELNNIIFDKEFDVDWTQLKGQKLFISKLNESSKKFETYRAKGFSQLTDTIAENNHNYKKLIKLYRVFIDNYKRWGDTESMNACYVEMRDIQTRMLEYRYVQTKNISNFFNWKLNTFLSYFCAYGTSPEKAIIFSMWTILLFSCVYFFFYSEWDGINRSFLILQYRKLSTYFTSEQKIDTFYTDNHRLEYDSYISFREELTNNKTKVPFFFHWLGKPLYGLSILRYSFMKWFYQRFEIIQGRWMDLSRSKKIRYGTYIAFYLILYTSYLIIIKCLNAIILSINAFSTLGFGSIPVKGTTRYFTILEGFIGWFLLSIFSVSLISQIMQI